MNTQQPVSVGAPRTAVRWQAANESELRAVVARLFDRRKAYPWCATAFDPHLAPTTHPGGRMLWFHPAQLMSLRHFELDRRMVECSVQGNYRPVLLQRMAQVARDLPVELANQFELVCRVRPVTAELALDIYFRCIIVDPDVTPLYSVEIIPFGNLCLPPLLRFFESAWRPLGMQRHMRVHASENGLRLGPRDVSDDSMFRMFAKSQGLFRFVLSESFTDSWGRIDRLLHGSDIERIERASLVVILTPQAYESFFDKANRQICGWQVQLIGGYAAGIDPYATAATQSPDGRFPILLWSDEQRRQGIYFQTDIVPGQPGGQLRIHSNCGSIEHLLQEAIAGAGVGFTAH